MTTPLARICAHVLFQPVADGGVLLDTVSETYYGLNAAGARICELLPRHDSVETLCAELATDYGEVPPNELRADVVELIAELLAHGLLQLPSPAQRDDRLVAPPAA